MFAEGFTVHGHGDYFHLVATAHRLKGKFFLKSIFALLKEIIEICWIEKKRKFLNKLI